MVARKKKTLLSVSQSVSAVPKWFTVLPSNGISAVIGGIWSDVSETTRYRTGWCNLFACKDNENRLAFWVWHNVSKLQTVWALTWETQQAVFLKKHCLQNKKERGGKRWRNSLSILHKTPGHSYFCVVVFSRCTGTDPERRRHWVRA